MARALIPELRLADPEAGAALLARLFGFLPGPGGRLVLGDQRLLVGQGAPDGRHGRIDHLALCVPDLGTALAGCLDRGGCLSRPTPEGPLAIPEFGATGVDYVFVEGPEGARVELIAPRAPAPRRPWGHDHLGISCAALAPMRAFFLDVGLTERAAVTLDRPGGRVDVSFLAWGDDVLELYCLPETRADPSLTAGGGFWRLRAEGLDGPRAGPEGVEVAPL